MQTLTLYLATTAIFLILDAAMLTLHMQPLFQRHLGAALLDSPRMGPAAAFYLAYIAGLLYLVSLPALKSGAPLLLPAAVLGANYPNSPWYKDAFTLLQSRDEAAPQCAATPANHAKNRRSSAFAKAKTPHRGQTNSIGLLAKHGFPISVP